MFDIGFGELIVVLVVGLFVVGPNKLPALTRVFGKRLRYAKQQWQDFKSEVSREFEQK